MKPRSGVSIGEVINLRKHMPLRRTEVLVGNRLRVKKLDAHSGIVKELTPWQRNTLHQDGLDEFIRLIAGTSSKHLDAANATIAIGNANPLVAFLYKKVGTDAGPTPTSDTKPEPSWSYLWEWHDDTTTARSNLNYAEMWYKDPEGGLDEYKVNNIQGDWGNKPSNEFWHWQMILEFYSTNTKFVNMGILQLLDVISGNSAVHFDQANTWFRPWTNADAGLGSTGINPDAAPTVDTVNDKLVYEFTAADGVYNGAWDKAEILHGAIYGSGTRLRYGGCKADGTVCGVKGVGETWVYPWELVFTQGT